MDYIGPNRPLVVWAACILWLTSVLAIMWSLLLFFFVGDMLFLTGTDLVNAVVLLSGIMMLPTNLYIMYSIAYGYPIDHKAKVGCCRLWICIAWIILVNVIGIILCLRRLYDCHEATMNYLSNSMLQYRKTPKHKHFIDNLQWCLGCCGIYSYKDWFTQDWHDRIYDYEWNPNARGMRSKVTVEMDSVPFSCCKSGSCVSNYLQELGTNSIYTRGCGMSMYRIIRISMCIHLFMFATVVVLEILLLRCIKKTKDQSEYNYNRSNNEFNVRHLMPINDNFEVSSGSYNMDGRDSRIENANEGEIEFVEE